MKTGSVVKVLATLGLVVLLAPAMAGNHEPASAKAGPAASAAAPMKAKAATQVKHHTTMTKKLGKEEALTVQKALVAKGYKIKADGKWGWKSHKALKEFQKKNGLKPTGHPDEKTLEALGLKPESK